MGSSRFAATLLVLLFLVPSVTLTGVAPSASEVTSEATEPAFIRTHSKFMQRDSAVLLPATSCRHGFEFGGGRAMPTYSFGSLVFVVTVAGFAGFHPNAAKSEPRLVGPISYGSYESNSPLASLCNSTPLYCYLDDIARFAPWPLDRCLAGRLLHPQPCRHHSSQSQRVWRRSPQADSLGSRFSGSSSGTCGSNQPNFGYKPKSFSTGSPQRNKWGMLERRRLLLYDGVLLLGRWPYAGAPA